MTSVSGHLTATKFDDEYERDWNYPPPEALFDAPVRVKVEEVWIMPVVGRSPNSLNSNYRTRNPFPPTSPRMQEGLELFLSGLTVTERESTLVGKLEVKLLRRTRI
jgi:hypothetical protein